MLKDYYIPQRKMSRRELKYIRDIVRRTLRPKKSFDASTKGKARLMRLLKVIECKKRSHMKRMAKEVARLDALDTSDWDFIPEYPPFSSIPQLLVFKLSCVTGRPWRPYYYD